MNEAFPTPPIKRIFDICAALVLIVLCSGLMLLVLVLYIVTGNLPVFFSQPRTGKAGRVFNMIKFRTLNAGGIPFGLGTILRATSMDELPQLFQVVSGNLSLVGPRPMLTEYDALFSDEQRKRFRVLPGITGWAQVNGRNAIAWTTKFQLDVWYTEHWSFWLDLKILAKTVVIILSFKPDVSLKETKFTGKEE